MVASPSRLAPYILASCNHAGGHGGIADDQHQQKSEAFSAALGAVAICFNIFLSPVP